MPLLAQTVESINVLRDDRAKGRLITTHDKYRSFKAHLSIILKIAYYRFTHNGKDPPTRMRSWVQKNVPDITTQDLRHSFVSILRSGNVDSELRSRIAGHTRKVDESIYTHIMDSALTEAVERAFESKKESIEGPLAVCRAMLTGQTVAHITDDAKRSLSKLFENLRVLVESDKTPSQGEASGAADCQQNRLPNQRNVVPVLYAGVISKNQNAEEIV